MELYEITLDNDGNGNNEMIYYSPSFGFCLDSQCENIMTTSTNPVILPEKTGYTFTGYYTSTNNGSLAITSEGYIDSSYLNTTINSNLTLYAVFDINSYYLTRDYNINHYFESTQYIDTGYNETDVLEAKVKIDVVVNIPTSGTRKLIIGNYKNTSNYALGLEVTTADKLRFWYGTSERYVSEETLPIGEDIHISFERVTGRQIIITATSTNLNISRTFSDGISTVGDYNLRIGTVDNRGSNNVFDPITVKSLKISSKINYNAVITRRYAITMLNSYYSVGAELGAMEWYYSSTGGDAVNVGTDTMPAHDTTIYSINTTAYTPTISYDNNVVTDGLQIYLDARRNTKYGHQTTTTWYDLSGNNKNGTVTNATWSDNYLSFNGSNSRVIAKASNSTNYTLEATVEIPEAVTDKTILANYETGGTGLFINSAGIPGFEVYISGSYRQALATDSLTPNVPHVLQGVYDGTTVKLYIDGALAASVAQTGNVATTGSSTVFAVGCNPQGSSCQGSYFAGKIYSAKVYNRGLTEAEVWQNYTMEKLNIGEYVDNDVTFNVTSLGDVLGRQSNININQYKIDSGVWTIFDSSDLPSLSASGDYDISANTRYINSTTSTTVTDTIHIDKTIPTGTVSASLVGGSIEATFSASDTYSGIDTTKYEWKVSTTSTCNSTTTGFISTNSVSYSYPVSDPDIYYACVKFRDKAGNYGYSSATVNTQIPLLSVSVPNGTAYAKSKTATITIADENGLAAGNYTIKYGWGTSAVACASMTNTTTINVTAGATSATGTVTISSGTGAGSIYICNSTAITNTIGNSLSANIVRTANMYLDNTAPTLSVSVTNGTIYAKSRIATITIADSISLAAGTYTIKYAWGTSAVACDNMTSTTSITVTGGASGTNGTVTISSGTGAGKIYICNSTAITDSAGNNLAAGATANADMYLDNTAPTLSVSVENGTTYAKSKTATITIADTSLAAGTYTIKYAWGTSAVACANMTSMTSITVTAGSTSTTKNVTISSGTGAGKIYICNSEAITDTATNSLPFSAANANMYLDNTAPTLSVSVENGTTYAKSKTATITISDTSLAAGTYTIKYAWGTSAVACANMTSTTSITATAGAASATGTVTISTGTGAGKIYICNSAAITDTATNSLAASTVKSADMYLDNTVPTVGISNAEAALPVGLAYTCATASYTTALTCADNVGVVGYYWGTTAPSSTTTYTSVASTTSFSTSTTVTPNSGTYYLSCKDSSGNITTTSNTYTHYTVKEYMHNVSGNVYTLNSTTTCYGVAGNTITAAAVGPDRSQGAVYNPGFTYVDAYTSGSTTKPTSGAITTTTVLADGSRIVNKYYRRNRLFIRYSKAASSATITIYDSAYGIYSGDNKLLTHTSNTYGANLSEWWSGVYGGTVAKITNADTYAQTSGGLSNYNGSTNYNISRSGYSAPSGKEWKCNDYTYDQDRTDYNVNTVANHSGCDISLRDCVITMSVNWVKN